MKAVTEEKIATYLDTTAIALERVRIAPALDKEALTRAHEVLDMAKRYHSDAQFFRQKGDLVTAFAAVNYAHGWIDCGVRVGLLSADEKDHRYIMPR
jgi:uncharacterized protein